MKTTTGSLFLALSLALSGCGQLDEAVPESEDGTAQAQAVCSAYLLDNANYSGPLPPFPVNGVVGACINLAAATTNRTSSFRLAGCRVRFFDGAGCTGPSYLAATSGVMPAFMNNRASSLRFQ